MAENETEAERIAREIGVPIAAPPEYPEVGPGIHGVIWRHVSGFFTAGFQAVWAGFTSMIPKATEALVWTFYGIYAEPTEKGLNTSFSMMEKWDWVDNNDLKAFESVKGWFFPFNAIVCFFIFMTFLAGYLKTKMFTMLGTLQQTLNKEHSPMPPQPREIMLSAFIAPEKTGEVREAMQRAGLSDKDIDLLFLAAYKLYDEEMVRVLWLRGVLSNDQMYMRMRELGYTDTRIKEIVQSWPIIPGPQDLFTMVAKEAFEPEFIEKIGLGAEFPVEQVEWLKKQGVSEEWARRYWYAHWDQPSIGQGFEMLHRGVIDLETLDLLFRAVEIPPFWRDKLTQIAYMPLTRVDVRRMHDMGVLTDEELIKAYKDLGYSDDNAQRMGEFTIRYNRGKEKELTRGQILQGYRDKLIPRPDAIDLLKQTDYNEAQVEYFLTLEDYKEQKKYQDDIIDNIEDRFTNNLIESFEARKRLNALNLPAVQVDLLMDSWDIKRYTDRKVPSKSDLDKFLRNKIIDLDKYRIEMARLGYGFQYVEWYEKLAALKK